MMLHIPLKPKFPPRRPLDGRLSILRCRCRNASEDKTPHGATIVKLPMVMFTLIVDNICLISLLEFGPNPEGITPSCRPLKVAVAASPFEGAAATMHLNDSPPSCYTVPQSVVCSHTHYPQHIFNSFYFFRH